MANIVEITRNKAAGKPVRRSHPFTLLHAGPDASAWVLSHLADGEIRTRYRVYRRRRGGWVITDYPSDVAAIEATGGVVEVAA
jgi:hypothetical protein